MSWLKQHITKKFSLKSWLSYKQSKTERKSSVNTETEANPFYQDIESDLSPEWVEKSNAITKRVDKRLVNKFPLAESYFIDWRLIAGILVAVTATLLWIFWPADSSRSNKSTSAYHQEEMPVESNTQETEPAQKVKPALTAQNEKTSEKELVDESTTAKVQSSPSNNQINPKTYPEEKSANSETAINPIEDIESKAKDQNQKDNPYVFDEITSQSDKEITGKQITGRDEEALVSTGTSKYKPVIHASRANVITEQNLWIYESQKSKSSSGSNNPDIGGKTTEKVKTFQYSMEDMPSYPGGTEKLKSNLLFETGQIKMPEGSVLKGNNAVVSFVVTPKGVIKDIKVLGQVPVEVENAITKAVTKLGYFNKGKKLGKKGSLLYQVSITFD